MNAWGSGTFCGLEHLPHLLCCGVAHSISGSAAKSKNTLCPRPGVGEVGVDPVPCNVPWASWKPDCARRRGKHTIPNK